MKDISIFKEALMQLKPIELTKKRVYYVAAFFIVLATCILGLENSSQYFNILIIPILTIILCYVLSNKIYYVFVYIFFIYSLKTMISAQLDARAIINPFIASLSVLMGIVCFCFYQLVLNNRSLEPNQKAIFLFVSVLSLVSCLSCFSYLYGNIFVRNNVEFLLDNYLEEKYPKIKKYDYDIDYSSDTQSYKVIINDNGNKDNDFIITYLNGELNDDYNYRMTNKTNIINRTYDYIYALDFKDIISEYIHGNINSISYEIIISDEDKLKLYPGMLADDVLKIAEVDVILSLDSNKDLHDKLIRDKIIKIFKEHNIVVGKLVIS